MHFVCTNPYKIQTLPMVYHAAKRKPKSEKTNIYNVFLVSTYNFISEVTYFLIG